MSYSLLLAVAEIGLTVKVTCGADVTNVSLCRQSCHHPRRVQSRTAAVATCHLRGTGATRARSTHPTGLGQHRIDQLDRDLPRQLAHTLTATVLRRKSLWDKALRDLRYRVEWTWAITI